MLYTREQRNITDALLPGFPHCHSILERTSDFCEREIISSAKALDADGKFPRENLSKVAGQGIFALAAGKEYGGAELPFPLYAAAIEVLAHACANTALQVSIQGMICEGIALFGSGALKDAFLKDAGLVEGRRLVAFALTEPCCGSDAKSIMTRAVMSGDCYILNGSKMLITNAAVADFSLVFAKTVRGISAFLVDSSTPGFKVMKVIPKLGFRANQLSEVRFRDCAVPSSNLLGEEGKGLDYAKYILNCGRITISAIGVGIAQAALDKAISYSGKRKAFGETLSSFQLVQEKISEMAASISTARLLTYYAAFSKHAGREFSLEAAKAKLFSSEAAIRVSDLAIQIHGGYGYTDSYDVHRHWRDARLLTIGEGTSDMLRLLIARRTLKGE